MPDYVIPDASILNGWRKSSYSGNEGGSCLEVLAGYPVGVPVRDSKDPRGPALIFQADAWSSFIAALRSGEFVAEYRLSPALTEQSAIASE
ncbi:hypothetical protein AA958_14160 [Streptomyces sp. CNQ-509]|uniref:DUF397 domain-containing protein n=1 Tax=Streptomyces sp. CNQ-509 TaxID=444103 RepID=UPI00062DF6FA|nr:DUF397 domain-containing protein [Streptomyces sp. CNQ-509]AKH83186.1 hypothetical protein AA958_14160 [Streptomyces sp. CNQ-509]